MHTPPNIYSSIMLCMEYLEMNCRLVESSFGKIFFLCAWGMILNYTRKSSSGRNLLQGWILCCWNFYCIRLQQLPTIKFNININLIFLQVNHPVIVHITIYLENIIRKHFDNTLGVSLYKSRWAQKINLTKHFV